MKGLNPILRKEQSRAGLELKPPETFEMVGVSGAFGLVVKEVKIGEKGLEMRTSPATPPYSPASFFGGGEHGYEAAAAVVAHSAARIRRYTAGECRGGRGLGAGEGGPGRRRSTGR
ncbi:hypothetical protein CRG98_031153 [Punica granatum]|uniref:Uncharacterized protein n=1 Tax=Punica granatum TaxID=22663 RepID=A0A2I0IWS6_PUNGR|nr:hypothetical protein CRG98_031153 [Punica granatum]